METTYLIAKAILKPWLWSWFDWSLEGIEKIPRRGPVLLAFNHISYLDPLAAAFAVDKAHRVPRFLAKSELFGDKRIAWILKGAKQIEVKRGTASAPMALDNALRSLERGECVVVFPEGTITTDPDLQPMGAKSGTARLALATGAPVLPCAIWGTQNVWPKGYRKNWKPKQDVCVRIGDELSMAGLSDDPPGWRAAGDRLMEEIGRLVASLRPVVPDRRRPKKRAA
ncbi:MAG TPA: lysophospholipid acyltransferase family protein [Actinomycetota bacterium]|nr:lysophospholipid acyltransferase family protein [Actinomycetota bacterium]